MSKTLGTNPFLHLSLTALASLAMLLVTLNLPSSSLDPQVSTDIIITAMK